MAARKRLPQGKPRPLPMRVNAASRTGIAQVRAVLTTDPTVVSDVDALAQMEQWRREDEARRNAQGCLRLGSVR